MKKKVCLVLGGGGARSFAHLGIMEIIQENDIEIQHLVTSSMGSLFGILLAHKLPIDQIKKAFHKRCKRFHWLRPGFGIKSFMNQKPAIELLMELLPSRLIEDCKIPITIVLTNINTMTTSIIEHGDAINAVEASSAHPLINKPLKYDNYYYADGGITNNVPADICREKCGDNAIVITATCSSPFNQEPKPLKKADLIIRTIYHALEKQRSSISQQFSDVIIAPFEHQYLDFRTWKTIFSFFNYKKLLEHYHLGRKAAQKKLPEIKALLGAAEKTQQT